MADLTILKAILSDGGAFEIRPSKCYWCYNLIYPKRGVKYKFCCNDCKEEWNDFKFLSSLTVKSIEKQKKRKEYLKEYALKNKDKRRENIKKAMKKYKLKIKVEKLNSKK